MLDQKISPMLAHPSDPFDSDDHIFEIKWDGTRCLLFADKSDIWLQNRYNKDISFRYPEITALRHRIKAKNAILDGELVVLSGGKPNFYRLQKRIHLQKHVSINRYARTMPATYVVFDILYLDGEKLLHVPLYRRKELIDGIIEPDRSLIVSHPFECKGSKLFKEARRYELEGIIAKKADSPYLMGVRSRYWLKIKSRHEAICYIVGLKMGSGFLGKNIGALILAERQGPEFCYCGDVGFGLSGTKLAEIRKRLYKLTCEAPSLPTSKRSWRIQWVKPELKCRVVYNERTPEGLLRAPVFKRLV